MALWDTCPSDAPFSAAFLLAPPGFRDTPLAAIEFELEHATAVWPRADAVPSEFAGSMGARLWPLLESLARRKDTRLSLPVNDALSLAIGVISGGS